MNPQTIVQSPPSAAHPAINWGSTTQRYGPLGLHTAAALFHHCVKQDNTLLRMLPRRD